MSRIPWRTLNFALALAIWLSLDARCVTQAAQLLPADCPGGTVLLDLVAGTGSYASSGLSGPPFTTPLSSSISYMSWNGTSLAVSEGSSVRLVNPAWSAPVNTTTISVPTYTGVVVLADNHAAIIGLRVLAFDSFNCVVVGSTDAGSSAILGGTPGSCGQGADGAPLSASPLNRPTAAVMTHTGILYFAERDRIRRLSISGSLSAELVYAAVGLSTIGTASPCSTTPSAANVIQLSAISALAWDAGAGRLYIADQVATSYCIRAASGGMVWAVAGGGALASSGAPATNSLLGRIGGMAIGISAQSLFYSQPDSNLVRVIANLSSGAAATVWDMAGDGSGSANASNGVAALSTSVYRPEGLAWDAAGARLLVADQMHAQVRQVKCVPGVTAKPNSTASATVTPSASRTASRSASRVSGSSTPTSSLSFGATASNTASPTKSGTRTTSRTPSTTPTNSLSSTAVPSSFPGFQACPAGSAPVIRRAVTAAALPLTSVGSLAWNSRDDCLAIADTGGNAIRRLNGGVGSSVGLIAGDGSDELPAEGTAADQGPFGQPSGLAFSPGYDVLFAGSSGHCAVYRIDSATGIIDRVLGQPDSCGEPAADYIDALDAIIEGVYSLATLELDGSTILYAMVGNSMQALYAVNLAESVPTVRRILGSTTGTTMGFPAAPQYCDPFAPWAKIETEWASVVTGQTRSGQPLLWASGGRLRTVNASLYQTCYAEIGCESSLALLQPVLTVAWRYVMRLTIAL